MMISDGDDDNENEQEASDALKQLRAARAEAEKAHTSCTATINDPGKIREHKHMPEEIRSCLKATSNTMMDVEMHKVFTKYIACSRNKATKRVADYFGTEPWMSFGRWFEAIEKFKSKEQWEAKAYSLSVPMSAIIQAKGKADIGTLLWLRFAALNDPDKYLHERAKGWFKV